MLTYTISSGAIRRFTYCPRWYFINYVLGFHAKSPMRAKVPIGDAIHKVLVDRSKTKYKDRISDLVRSEDIVNEDVGFDELVARGELLADKALEWIGKFDALLWQEKLVQHKLVYEDQEIVLTGYPDLVASKHGENYLIDYKIGYDVNNEHDAFSYALPFMLYKLGLLGCGIQTHKSMVASMVIRTRKERYSARAKTPIVDIIEVPIVLSDTIKDFLSSVAVSIITCIKTQNFPALGITNGVCSWCPNGKILKEQRLCFYPDEILKEFSRTSLQRMSIEKWRDEI